MRYSSEWKKTVLRSGRWIDFEKDYKTLEPEFMVFLFQKADNSLTTSIKGECMVGIQNIIFKGTCAYLSSYNEASH
jgi:hypothetical protein